MAKKIFAKSKRYGKKKSPGKAAPVSAPAPTPKKRLHRTPMARGGKYGVAKGRKRTPRPKAKPAAELKLPPQTKATKLEPKPEPKEEPMVDKAPNVSKPETKHPKPKPIAKKAMPEAKPKARPKPKKPAYDKMSYRDLQKLCTKNGLKASGKKEDLIKRLNTL